MKKRLESLLAEYGPIAIVVYLSLFALTMAGFVVAIVLGFDVEGTAAGAGTLAAAWVAAKVTQPLRIVVTLAVTPLLGRFVRHRRTKPPHQG